MRISTWLDIAGLTCGCLIILFLAVCALIVFATARAAAKPRPKPQPKPGWTVKAVGTPALAAHGIPQLFHVYSPDGAHMCNTDESRYPFCYLTRAEAEDAARIGEQFTDLVLSAGEQNG